MTRAQEQVIAATDEVVITKAADPGDSKETDWNSFSNANQRCSRYVVWRPLAKQHPGVGTSPARLGHWCCANSLQGWTMTLKWQSRNPRETRL